MSYYDRQVEFVAGTTARADEVNAELNAILAGFNLLPSNTSALREGFATFETDIGSDNSYAVEFSPARTSYSDGASVSFVAANANTGASTMQFDSLSTVPIVNPLGEALVAGDILAGIIYELRYDSSGNRFILMNWSGDAANASISAAAAQVSATAAAESAAAALASENAAAVSAAALLAAEFESPTLTLNADETGSPSEDAGIIVERGTSSNVSLLWNETADRWTFSNGVNITGGITTTEGYTNSASSIAQTFVRPNTYAGGELSYMLWQDSTGNHGYLGFANGGSQLDLVAQGSNDLRLAGNTISLDDATSIGGTLGVTGVTSIGSPAGSGGASYGQLAVKGAANTVYGSWDNTTAGFGYQTVLAQGVVVGYLGQGSSVATGVADGLSIRSEGDLELWAGGGNLAVSFDTNTRNATFSGNIIPNGGSGTPKSIWSSGNNVIMQMGSGGSLNFNDADHATTILSLSDADNSATFAGVIKLANISDGVDKFHVYTNSDDSFRINFNGAGNDEFVLEQSGELTLTTVSDYTNQLALLQSGSNASLYSYADAGGAGLASASGTGYSCLIYMKETANAIDFYTNGTYAGQWSSSQGLTVQGEVVTTNAAGKGYIIEDNQIQRWGGPGETFQFYNSQNGGFDWYNSSQVVVMALTESGALSTTTGSLGTLSERRFKENITPATSQWDDTKSLASLMKNYNLKNGDGKKLLGWVVDEIEEDFPSLVFEREQSDGDLVKGVNLSAITYKGVGALGEALVRIEELESEVSLLKSEVAELRAA